MSIEEGGLTMVEQYLKVEGLWLLMCSHDGIDPQATVIVFSADNPYQAAYHTAARELRQAMIDRAMRKGRAT